MNTIYQVQPLTLGDVATYPLASRKSKVSVTDFAKAIPSNAGISKFCDSLPGILAADDLKAVLSGIQLARRNSRTILWGTGGHVIKTGLGPLMVDLMRRGFVSGIAMNGAALIHDFEIALSGRTSEDVAAGLEEGKFGMATETGLFLNQIESSAAFSGMGYGEAAGISGWSQALAAKRASQRARQRVHTSHPRHNSPGDRYGHSAHAPCGGRRGPRRRHAS
jgi:hypothetical protein